MFYYDGAEFTFKTFVSFHRMVVVVLLHSQPQKSQPKHQKNTPFAQNQFDTPIRSKLKQNLLKTQIQTTQKPTQSQTLNLTSKSRKHTINRNHSHHTKLNKIKA